MQSLGWQLTRKTDMCLFVKQRQTSDDGLQSGLLQAGACCADVLFLVLRKDGYRLQAYKVPAGPLQIFRAGKCTSRFCSAFCM